MAELQVGVLANLVCACACFVLCCKEVYHVVRVRSLSFVTKLFASEFFLPTYCFVFGFTSG